MLLQVAARAARSAACQLFSFTFVYRAAAQTAAAAAPPVASGPDAHAASSTAKVTRVGKTTDVRVAVPSLLPADIDDVIARIRTFPEHRSGASFDVSLAQQPLGHLSAAAATTAAGDAGPAAAGAAAGGGAAAADTTGGAGAAAGAPASVNAAAAAGDGGVDASAASPGRASKRPRLDATSSYPPGDADADGGYSNGEDDHAAATFQGFSTPQQQQKQSHAPSDTDADATAGVKGSHFTVIITEEELSSGAAQCTVRASLEAGGDKEVFARMCDALLGQVLRQNRHWRRTGLKVVPSSNAGAAAAGGGAGTP